MNKANKVAFAQAYASYGLPVFPLHNVTGGICSCGAGCETPGKHPRTKHGFKDATMDVDQIKRWWKRWPDANIGVATGADVGLVVVDVDVRNDGHISLLELESNHEMLPETVQVLTGGGGQHFCFRHSGGSVNGGRLQGYPGIDIKADGGYVVGVGSDHMSGKRYEWEISSVLGEVALAELPEWLLKLMRSTNGSKPSPHIPTVIRGGEGRNNHLTSLAGTLRRKGASKAVILAALHEANREICDPPLLEAEVEAIATSIVRYQPHTGPSSTHISRGVGYIERDKPPPDSKRDTNVTQNVTDRYVTSSDEMSRSEMLSRRVGQWVEKTFGWWTTEELDRDLVIVGRKQKDNRRQILGRLREQGIIEQHPRYNKQFRFVNKAVTALAGC